jgi:curved DNA-binding protein CbpA
LARYQVFSVDLYSTLGISRTASPEAIRRAYKRAVSASHPDKHRGAPEMEKRLRALNAAYAVLKDPAKRASYDQSLRQDAAPRPVRVAPPRVVVVVPVVDVPETIPLSPRQRWDYWLAGAFFAAGILIALILSATDPR